MTEQVNPLESVEEVKPKKVAKKKESTIYKFKEGKLFGAPIKVEKFYKGKNHKGEKVYN
jgi:CRISPR/Cas system-associated protein Cas5 (RAMP superfamily)